MKKNRLVLPHERHLRLVSEIEEEEEEEKQRMLSERYEPHCAGTDPILMLAAAESLRC